MSLCNVTFDGDDGVSFWTDTAVATHDGADLGQATKAWPVPVLQAAVAVRGDLPLLAHVGAALLVPYTADFDQALRGLAQGGLDRAAAHNRENLPGTGGLNHVVIAGWSTAAQGYRAATFLQVFDKPFEATPFDTDMFSPWPAEFGPTPPAGDLAAMIDAAERQCALIKSHNKGYAAGGRLQRTRLLPGGAGIEVTFPHTFAEPRA